MHWDLQDTSSPGGGQQQQRWGDSSSRGDAPGVRPALGLPPPGFGAHARRAWRCRALPEPHGMSQCQGLTAGMMQAARPCSPSRQGTATAAAQEPEQHRSCITAAPRGHRRGPCVCGGVSFVALLGRAKSQQRERDKSNYKAANENNGE